MEASSTGPIELNEKQGDSETLTEENERKTLESVEEDNVDNVGTNEYLGKEEEKNDSDSHSDALSSNDEQNHQGSGSNSQFYESNDSKVDYAVKIDDNDTLSDIEDIKTDSASADSEDSALGSLPPDSTGPDREEEAQDRSEGSDSGIGSETLEDVKLSNFNLVLPCTDSLKLNSETENKSESVSYNIHIDNNIESHNTFEQKTPVKSSLKRKHDKENLDVLTKRKKHSIKFDNVTVYYFQRAQGFSCVPSQGGSTLGMESDHSHVQKFTLAEHAVEQRRLHRQVLQQLKSERHSLQGVSLSSSEDSDTEEEEASDISDSELDLDSYYFLQPVSTRQRRSMLRAAGVRKIEGYEKDECRDIRTSREFCGCACKGTCNPETCSCSLGGIKCQVDRLNFPCGCTRDGCSNTTGRIEFNPVRVRTHFIHTLMRVGLEKKKEENEEAAKRQWAHIHNLNPQSQCLPNAGYERNHKRNQDDGLVRDVNLAPRVEVESCVSAGNFSSVHCDLNNMANQTTQSIYYRNENLERVNVNENSMHYDTTNTHHNLTDPYTSSILQRKAPPYSTATLATMSYEAMPNNTQRFPCDLNYTYDLHNDNNHFKGLQSFSASSFEEFAHTSHMNMFSQYGHNTYTPDYMHKPSVHDHSVLQYQNVHQIQNHYEMYKNPIECVNNGVKGEYATLMTSPYQDKNKLQTVENDENWFSQNTLLNLDQVDEATHKASDLPAQSTEVATETTTQSESTENFGELIKQTMVESVTV